MSLLDTIASEVANLSDEEIAQAAAKIMDQRAKAAARVTPETIAKMKEREKARRAKNSAILKLAKERGLVPADTKTT